jgi:phospholipase B1, membrane-associated
VSQTEQIEGLRQPGKVVDIKHYPIEALSPIDCFHPSEMAHQRMAAGLWNRLTLNKVCV